MKIKVCGMRDALNIKELVKIKPDYIGFIFYAKSKRYVEDGFDHEILNEIPHEIERVGVFVNETIDMLVKNYNRFKLNYVQLHGNEPPEYCEELKLMKIKSIKSFLINDDFDFTEIEPYKKHCNYFLFDTKSEYYGGTGKKFNWEILKNYDNEKPFFLSGGIGDDDSGTISLLEDINIHALDINSRFEIEPGLKDIDKIESFIKKIKNKN